MASGSSASTDNEGKEGGDDDIETAIWAILLQYRRLTGSSRVLF